MADISIKHHRSISASASSSNESDDSLDSSSRSSENPGDLHSMDEDGASSGDEKIAESGFVTVTHSVKGQDADSLSSSPTPKPAKRQKLDDMAGAYSDTALPTTIKQTTSPSVKAAEKPRKKVLKKVAPISLPQAAVEESTVHKSSALDNGLEAPPAHPEVNSSQLISDILCDIADFAVDLASKVARRVGSDWRPSCSCQSIGCLGNGNTVHSTGQVSNQQDMSRTAAASKKRRVVKEVDPNRPRRPLTAYNSWCEHIRKRFKAADPTKALKLTDLAEMWRDLPHTEKIPWETKASEARAAWILELELYKQSVKNSEIVASGEGGPG